MKAVMQAANSLQGRAADTFSDGGAPKRYQGFTEENLEKIKVTV